MCKTDSSNSNLSDKIAPQVLSQFWCHGLTLRVNPSIYGLMWGRLCDKISLQNLEKWGGSVIGEKLKKLSHEFTPG